MNGLLPDRLGARLALAALVVGAFGWLFGSTVIRQSARGALRAEAVDASRTVVDRIAKELDGRIDGFERALEVLAVNESVATLSADAGTELAVAIRAVPELGQLVLTDLDGDVVAAASSSGTVVPSVDGRDAAPSGSVHIVRTGGAPIAIEIAVAVESPPGSPVGTLRGRVDLDAVVRALQPRSLGQSTKAVIVGLDGTVLDHPERDRVVRADRYPIDDLLERDDRAMVGEVEGTSVIRVAAEPAGFPGVVVIERDEEEAFAAVDAELDDLTLLVAAAVAATVLVVLFVGNRLMAPLDGLVLTLRRLGEGEREARAEVVGSAEFRDVATEVNRMAGAIERQMEALETADADLRAAEERFRAAFEAAPQPMLVRTAGGSATMVNAPMVALMGRSDEELRGIDWPELTHPDDIERTREALRAAERDGSDVLRIQKRYQRPDGTSFPALTSVAIVRDEAGRPSYFITHIVDLSDLHEAEERFRRIVEASPDVLIITDLDGIVEVANERVFDVFGYRPVEVVGQPIEMLLPERSRSLHAQHRARYAADPSVREMGADLQLFGLAADGLEMPIEVGLSPIHSEGQVKVLAAVRDVTERRAGEAATRRLREMQMLQRQAMEINDNVVQSLTIAQWSFELDRVDDARAAVLRTLEAARALVDRMVVAAGDVEPGDLRRERPAEFGS